MLEKHARLLRDFLGVAIEAAGVGTAAGVAFEDGGFFTIAATGIEVVREKGGWRIREVYDVADLDQGGFRTVEETVATLRLGDESMVAKQVAMRAVERRIDKALDGMM